MKEGKHRASRCFLRGLRVTANLQDNHWDACHLLQLFFSWNAVFLPFLCPSQEFSWWGSFLKSQGSLLNSVFTEYKSFQLTHTNMFLYRITPCWHFNIILPGYFFFQVMIVYHVRARKSLLVWVQEKMWPHLRFGTDSRNELVSSLGKKD